MTDKEKQSIALIREYAPYANKFGGYKVAFSGGKDSQVMLDLFKRSGVTFTAYYSVTTNDPPENVYFIRKNYPEVQFILPKLNFFQLMAKKNAIPRMNMRFCCAELKENNLKGWVATGIRKEESHKRATYSAVNYYNRKEYPLDSMTENDKILLYPILEWREDEIWQYIEDKNLPINPCYETSGRVGCIFCPFASKKQLYYKAKRYPRYYALFLKTIKKLLDNGYLKCFQPLTPEEVFEWWASKQSARQYFTQLKLDL